MEINWTTVIVQGLQSLPGILTAFAAVCGAVLAGVAAWHTARARKEINGKMAELVAAKEAKAASDATIIEKEREQQRQDELRGTSEDRKVP